MANKILGDLIRCQSTEVGAWGISTTVKNCQDWGGRFILAACAIGGAITLTGCFAVAFSANRASAQVTPDPNTSNALGTNVTQNGTIYNITGGAKVGGTNVFYSFGSFSVPPEWSANFIDAAGFTNIFGRVTGGSPSNIQGTIQVKGNANLFLINPSGITFGPNARLVIGGSFVGTTANAIRFPGGGEFSRTSPVDPNNQVLAVNPSALFFNQTPAGAIINQSQGDGLRVPDGRSLLLVGGDVRLEGGLLQAPGGRIELGGLAAPGEVEVKLRNNNIGLGFPEGVARANISLTNKAEVNASILSGGGDDAGIVIMRGNNVFLDNSNIFSQILSGGQGNAGGILIEAGSLTLDHEARIASSSFGSGSAGAILIEVDGPVSLSNTSSIQSNVENGATNSIGGLVSIKAGSLSLLSGSQVQTLVRGNERGQQPGQGDAGKIFIDASDSITIDGVGLLNGELFSSAIFSSVGSGASGNAGNIEISTRTLSLSNSGFIDTSLAGFGTAGSIFIDATDSVSLANNARIETVIKPGARESRGANSPFAGNIIGALLGRGGDVTGTILISTGSLSLTDGSVLNTSTLGDGNAGGIVVAARDDVSLKGGVIGSAVGEQATGNAGAILMAVGSLSIASTSTNPAGLTTETGGQGDAGLIYVVADKDISIRGEETGQEVGISSEVKPGLTGTGGGIILEARSLFLRDGAKVSVDNKGSGVAGDIDIQVREDVILRDQGQIRAISVSGEGGNIHINQDPEKPPGDFLVLVNGSQVSTQVGNGLGGNISVNARYIIAAPFKDNNIDAFAQSGQGGVIDITTNRLYDIAERPDVRISNDIDPTARSGVNGILTATVLNIDPTQGLSNLPTNPIDPTRLIAETCAPRGGITERQKNQFIVTNRGGLPPDPNAAFPGEAVVTDEATPNEPNNNQLNHPGSTNPTSSTPTAIASPQQQENQPNHPSSTNPTSSTSVAIASRQESNIVEAQGWVFDKNGDVIFTAQGSTATSNATSNYSVLTPASTCNGSSTQP